jgi:PKD repeat protein
VAGAAAPSVDAITLGPTIAIDSGCSPVKAKRKVTKKGTKVTATWKSCRNVKGKATLTATLDTTCDTLKGSFKPGKGKKKVPFTATRSRCDDDVYDAGGEPCDAGRGCAAGQACTKCACGATGGPNAAPAAAFVNATAGAVRVPVVFDARGSSDPDGDALSFSWDFGDGMKGGSAQLAHLYAAPGAFTVTLTVADGRGGIATAMGSVTIAPGPTPTGTVAAQGIVRAIGNAALAGVTVTVESTGANGTTGADGKVSVNVPRGAPALLRLAKTGYADQILPLAIPDVDETTIFEAVMSPREPVQPLADAAAGGALGGKDGASLTLPPNALVGPGGTPVTGAVDVSLTPVDPQANEQAFPGRFAGIAAGGEDGLLLSYGTVEFELSQGGQPLQLAPGKTGTVEIPVYTPLNSDGTPVAIGDTAPLWSLDERTGIWIQEGFGTVVASATSPTGLALRGQVAHLSWWNHDDFSFPPYNPKPRCLVDTNHDGVLEDLTGTGYCWHAGTGPEQPDDGFDLAGDPPALADAPPRVPAFAAQAWTPAGGGVILPVPAGLPITLRSTANFGTLVGTTVLLGAANVEEVVNVVLEPLDVSGADPITLPWDQQYPTGGLSPEQYTFNGTAGTRVIVAVGRSAGTLEGQVLLERVGGAAVGNGTFGANAAAIHGMLPSTGQYRIVVNPTNGNGTFRLVARAFVAGEGTPIALPYSQATLGAAAEVDTYRFAGAQGVGATISCGRTGNSLLEGTIVLFGPTGQVVGSATFGAAPGVLTPTLPATGNYTVMVISSTAASYTLGVGVADGSQSTHIATIPHDSTATLAVASEVDEFTFDGAVGDPVFIDVRRTAGSQARAFVSLRDPDGVQLLSEGMSTGQFVSVATLELVLTEAGRYRIVIAGVAAGGYRITVKRTGEVPLVLSVSPPDGATDVPLNATVGFTITDTILEPVTVGASGGTFKVYSPAGDNFSVAGNLVVNGASATFTPSAPLPPSVLMIGVLEKTLKQASNQQPLQNQFVWTFRTVDGLLGAVPVGEGNVPSIAVAPNGEAHLVYRGRRWVPGNPPGTLENGVVTTRYTPGVGWSLPITLRKNPNSQTGGAIWPRVAWGGDGSAIAVFSQDDDFDGDPRSIWGARYTSAGGWEPAVAIENLPGTMGWQQGAPFVAVDGGGDAVVVWHKLGSTPYEFWGTRFVGGVWDAVPTLLSDDATLFPQSLSFVPVSPRVALDAAGDGFVATVWNGTVVVRRYAGGVFEAPERIDDLTADTHVRDRVALGVDAAGNALAVFLEQSTFYARRFDAETATWEAPVVLQTTDQGADTAGQSISLAMGADGGAFVGARAYKNAETAFIAWTRRFVPDGGSGTWEPVQTTVVGNSVVPHFVEVGRDAAGNGLVVTHLSSGAPFFRRYLVGSGWEQTTTPLPGLTGIAGDIAFNPFGMGAGGDAFTTGVNPGGNGSPLFAFRIQ